MPHAGEVPIQSCPSHRHPSFDEAVAREERRLDTARQLLIQLQRASVLGQLRDFSQVLDSNLAGIHAHSNTRGHQMRHRWNSL